MTRPTDLNLNSELEQLALDLKAQAERLGFDACAITLPDARSEAQRLKEWLGKGYQGEMEYLANHFEKRIDPSQLVEGTQRIILLRMNYLPEDTRITDILRDKSRAYIARYTLGRDYHKLVRARLKQLGTWLTEQAKEQVSFRPFVDSAPILERPLARQAGLGWIGKHTLLLNREAGSWFFLGSLFTNLPLPVDKSESDEHCGRCTACMDVCPTAAFPEPYVLDARRCISYLTIEQSGPIPEELRPLMGNRVFGCDDCQLICPWNRFAQRSPEEDFKPRHGLDSAELIELFQWSEEEFLAKTEGSAIRRTGYQGWMRNLAVALGNGPCTQRAVEVLTAKRGVISPLVDEHIEWALQQFAQQEERQTEPLFIHAGAKRLPR
jgi:epoxyqueuosine reductase